MRKTASTLTIISMLLIALLLVVFVPSLKAISEDPQLQWSKTYGYISGVSILQVDDGDLLIVADSGAQWYYAGHGGYDYTNRTDVLLRIDLNGNVVWRKQLPTDSATLVATEDGGFAFAYSVEGPLNYGVYLGLTNYTYHNYFPSLVKTDSQGNILWNQTYENLTQIINSNSVPVRFSANSVQQTRDGGFVLGGVEYISNVFTDYKAWLIKTDSLGNMMWINTYGELAKISNSVQSVVETPDDGFLFVGYVDGNHIVKTDSTGKIQWTKAYDDAPMLYPNTEFYSMKKTKQGDFIMAGYRGEYPQSAYVVKLNSALDTVWNRTYGNYTSFAIKGISDDSYLFTDHIQSGNSLIKTDLEGNIAWEYKSNGTITSAIQTKDGGYALTGKIPHPNVTGTMSPRDITDIMVERLAENARTGTLHSIPELLLWIFLPIVAVIIVATAIICLRKRKRQHSAL